MISDVYLLEEFARSLVTEFSFRVGIVRVAEASRMAGSEVVGFFLSRTAECAPERPRAASDRRRRSISAATACS